MQLSLRKLFVLLPVIHSGLLIPTGVIRVSFIPELDLLWASDDITANPTGISGSSA